MEPFQPTPAVMARIYQHCGPASRHYLVKTSKHWHTLTAFILEKMHCKLTMNYINGFFQLPKSNAYTLKDCQTVGEIRAVAVQFLKTLSATKNLGNEQSEHFARLFAKIDAFRAKGAFTKSVFPTVQVFHKAKGAANLIVEDYVQPKHARKKPEPKETKQDTVEAMRYIIATTSKGSRETPLRLCLEVLVRSFMIIQTIEVIKNLNDPEEQNLILSWLVEILVKHKIMYGTAFQGCLEMILSHMTDESLVAAWSCQLSWTT